ncbi:acyl-CoA dehydrogenase family protein [Dactylosporangium sp. NPDC005572]|uniref:acyl-CoA dehydrogenase family protein n=1 Tax=Dactylosporangium sp. NPDC005572 TaxID=3156889 RepID=UPI0033A457BF
MTLAEATRRFVRDVVLPGEPPPGQHLAADARRRLLDAAEEYGVFAPHVGTELGGRGLGVQDWPAVFQEAGCSAFGSAALHCMAADEDNMHLLELVATTDQQERYLTSPRPLGPGRRSPRRRRAVVGGHGVLLGGGVRGDRPGDAAVAAMA